MSRNLTKSKDKEFQSEVMCTISEYRDFYCEEFVVLHQISGLETTSHRLFEIGHLIISQLPSAARSRLLQPHNESDLCTRD